MSIRIITLSGAVAAILLSAGCVRAVASTVGAAADVGVGAVKAGTGVAAATVDAATPDGKKAEDSHHEDGHHDDDPRPFDASADAMMDVDVALAAARVSGRNVLLALGGNWCHDSRGLAAKFQEPELAALVAESYELVWVDVGYRDRNLDVAERFGVDALYGTPTILILSPAGALLNADTVHDWRTADSVPYDKTLAYFQRFAPQSIVEAGR